MESSQIDELLRYLLHFRRSNADIKDAAKAWCADRTVAEEKFGKDWSDVPEENILIVILYVIMREVQINEKNRMS